MKPIKFKGVNITFGEGQPQYQPLPAYKAPDGQVVTCWELTEEERAEVAKTGKVWISQLTFGQALQPQLPSITTPEIIERVQSSLH